MKFPFIMAALHYWCAARHIPLDDVEITVRFKDQHTAQFAFDHLVLEATPVSEVRPTMRGDTFARVLGTAVHFVGGKKQNVCGQP